MSRAERYHLRAQRREAEDVKHAIQASSGLVKGLTKEPVEEQIQQPIQQPMEVVEEPRKVEQSMEKMREGFRRNPSRSSRKESYLKRLSPKTLSLKKPSSKTSSVKKPSGRTHNRRTALTSSTFQTKCLTRSRTGSVSAKSKVQAPLKKRARRNPPPTETNVRLGYLLQHNAIGYVKGKGDFFLLVRVPDTTDEYQLRAIQSDGASIEPSEVLKTDLGLRNVIPMQSCPEGTRILRVEFQNDTTAYLTTDNNWKSIDVIMESSPGHKHFYLTKYLGQNLNSRVPQPLHQDDFTIICKQGIEVRLSLSYIYTKSADLGVYLKKNSTDHVICLNYSPQTIQALVSHFYEESAKPLEYETSLELFKLSRSIEFLESDIQSLAEEGLLQQDLTIQQAFYTWKLAVGASPKVCLHCVKQFQKRSQNRSSTQEYIEGFQTLTADELKEFFQMLPTVEWDRLRPNS